MKNTCCVLQSFATSINSDAGLIISFFLFPFLFASIRCANKRQSFLHDSTLFMSVIQKKWPLGAGTGLLWEENVKH